MVGRVGQRQVLTPFEETYRAHRPIPAELLALVASLAH